jgi:rubrerythrin
VRKLIDLEAAIEIIRFDSDRTPDDLDAKQTTAYRNGMYAAINSISSCPATEAVPVVHGRWHKSLRSVFMNYKNGECAWVDKAVYRCSECHFGTIIKHNYCPNCGARMDGD